MSQQDSSVSGLDIYHKLGTLEGKVDALIARTTEYRNDLQDAFVRIAAIENRLAWVMGATVVISIACPLILNVLSKSFNVNIDPVIENSRPEYRQN